MLKIQSCFNFNKKSGQNRPPPIYRMIPDFAAENKFVFFTPNGGNIVQLLDLSDQVEKLT